MMMAGKVIFVTLAVISLTQAADHILKKSIDDRPKECQDNENYCMTFCRSSNQAPIIEARCGQDKTSCICTTSDGHSVKVRFIEERDPLPSSTPPTSAPRVQYITSEPIYSDGMPQLLICDGSEAATNLCRDFCIQDVRAYTGKCNTTDETCLCVGVSPAVVQPVPITAIYQPTPHIPSQYPPPPVPTTPPRPVEIIYPQQNFWTPITPSHPNYMYNSISNTGIYETPQSLQTPVAVQDTGSGYYYPQGGSGHFMSMNPVVYQPQAQPQPQIHQQYQQPSILPNQYATFPFMYPYPNPTSVIPDNYQHQPQQPQTYAQSPDQQSFLQNQEQMTHQMIPANSNHQDVGSNDSSGDSSTGNHASVPYSSESMTMTHSEAISSAEEGLQNHRQRRSTSNLLDKDMNFDLSRRRGCSIYACRDACQKSGFLMPKCIPQCGETSCSCTCRPDKLEDLERTMDDVHMTSSGSTNDGEIMAAETPKGLLQPSKNSIAKFGFSQKSTTNQKIPIPYPFIAPPFLF